MSYAISTGANGVATHFVTDLDPAGLVAAIAGLGPNDILPGAVANAVVVDGDMLSRTAIGGWNVREKNILIKALDTIELDLSVENFVHVDADFQRDTDGANFTAANLKRGNVLGSDAADVFNLTLTTNDAGWSNVVQINAAGGDDTVTLADGVAQVGNARLHRNAEIVDGRFTTVIVDLGGGEDAFLNTTVATDSVRGGEGDDTITTGGGGDTVDGGAGSDVIDTGEGVDVAAYEGRESADFTLFRQADGSVLVSDLVSGDRDTVTGAENFAFADVTIREPDIADQPLVDAVDDVVTLADLEEGLSIFDNDVFARGSVEITGARLILSDGRSVDLPFSEIGSPLGEDAVLGRILQPADALGFTSIFVNAEPESPLFGAFAGDFLYNRVTFEYTISDGMTEDTATVTFDPEPLLEPILFQGEEFTLLNAARDPNPNLIRLIGRNQERDPIGTDLPNLEPNPGLPEYDQYGLRPGYTGEGYLDIQGSDTGPQAAVSFFAPADAYEITVRYANGTTAARPITIDVSGVKTTIADTRTTAWHDYVERTFEVELPRGGAQTLTILQDGSGGAPNIDAVAIAPVGTDIDFLA